MTHTVCIYANIRYNFFQKFFPSHRSPSRVMPFIPLQPNFSYPTHMGSYSSNCVWYSSPERHAIEIIYCINTRRPVPETLWRSKRLLSLKVVPFLALQYRRFKSNHFNCSLVFFRYFFDSPSIVLRSYVTNNQQNIIKEITFGIKVIAWLQYQTES